MLIFYIVLCIFIAALVALADYACGMEKLQDSSGTIINPATSEDVDAATTSIDAVRSAVTTSTLNVNDATAILWQQYLWSALTASVLNTSTTGTVKITDGTDTLLVNTDGSVTVKGNITSADGAANPTTAVTTDSRISGWNGTGWDRVRSVADNADGVATSAIARQMSVLAKLSLYNGTTFDRARGDSTYGMDVDVVRMPAMVSHETGSSLSVVSGHKNTYNVHLDVQNASGTVGYMLIDLSDTTNWKHTATGHIVVEKIIVNVNPSTAYLGDIEIGFLSAVGATDSDLNKIIVVHGERSAVGSTETYDFAMSGLDLETSNWFGPVTANDTTFQTDVNLYGPSGATSFPSGTGDLVMKLISTAGNIDIGVTIVYTTGS